MRDLRGDLGDIAGSVQILTVGDDGAGADGKFRLPLDLVSKIASLACTAERASETPFASGSGGPEDGDGL